jgi:hypothetical protein
MWSNLWDIFFMVFETMEEFSVHLIKPVWGSIFTLFPKRTGGETLHSKWLELLLLQSFNHTNLGVQRMCLAAFYDIDFNEYEIFFDEKFACGNLTIYFSNFIDTIFDYFVSAKMYWKKEKMGQRILEFYPRYLRLLPRENRHLAVSTMLKKLRKNFGRATICYLLAALSRVESDFGDDIIRDLDIVYETHVVSM